MKINFFGHIVADEFDEWDNYDYSWTYVQNESNEGNPRTHNKCSCPMSVLMSEGCICGAFKEEKENKKENKDAE